MSVCLLCLSFLCVCFVWAMLPDLNKCMYVCMYYNSHVRRCFMCREYCVCHGISDTALKIVWRIGRSHFKIIVRRQCIVAVHHSSPPSTESPFFHINQGLVGWTDTAYITMNSCWVLWWENMPTSLILSMTLTMLFCSLRFSAGALPGTPLGELMTLPGPPCWLIIPYPTRRLRRLASRSPPAYLIPPNLGVLE